MRVEVERLDIKPGDRLILRVQDRLTQQTMDMLRARIRELLPLPDDVQLLILDCGATLEAEPADREITR